MDQKRIRKLARDNYTEGYQNCREDFGSIIAKLQADNVTLEARLAALESLIEREIQAARDWENWGDD